MKKNGFTLAEVLVTLGIIGVVAALTTPALIQNVGDAKIGPRLQKAKATFETASEMMLNDQSANSLMAIGSTSADIGNALQNYMKISHNTTKYAFECDPDIGSSGNQVPASSTSGNNSTSYERYDSDDGMTFWIRVVSKQTVANDYPANLPNNQLIGLVAVDINGTQNPNRTAKDVFPFLLYNDGTLRPFGGTNANRSTNSLPTWSATNCGATSVSNPRTCTGSIFENGMKVIYDYVPAPLGREAQSQADTTPTPLF